MKKILAVLFALVLVLSFAGCSGEKDTTEDNADEATTVSTVDTTAATTEATEPVTEAPKGSEPVAVGNLITLPFAEMTIEEAGFANDIKQSIKNGSFTYTSGPDSSDETEFVYIRGKVKNTAKSALDGLNIEGTVEVDGYSYEIDSNVIESDGSSAYSLDPLMEYTYTLYAAVPNTLVDVAASGTLTFEFIENFAWMSSNTESEYSYVITIAK